MKKSTTEISQAEERSSIQICQSLSKIKRYDDALKLKEALNKSNVRPEPVEG
jgi:hypothetical protein